jgi:hypothetical protein
MMLTTSLKRLPVFQPSKHVTMQVVEDILSGKIEGKPYKSDDPPVQKKRVKV